MKLRLVKLTEDDKARLADMMGEWEACGEKIVPAAIRKENYRDFARYQDSLEVREAKDGLVTDSTFFCLDEERDIFVGAVNIRHSLNEELLLWGGHIGDGVRPSERRKGVATRMIAMALLECEKLGIDKVLMVCDKSNTGSAKSIQNNGGILENEVEVNGVINQRFWIDIGWLRDMPPRVRELFEGRPYRMDRMGMSGSRVLLFEDRVLKIQPAGEEAENEYRILKWLEGSQTVPTVLACGEKGGLSYLMMSRMRGKVSCDEGYLKDPEALLRILTEGLRTLWSMDAAGCPCDNTLDRKLRRAKYNVEAGLVDMDNVEPETFSEKGFRDPEELWEWLNANRPKEEVVVSHGDYCLPNIFGEEGRFSGFIDLGRMGKADKWQDIALCYRSLRDNYAGVYGGPVHEKADPALLFWHLGIEPDWEKIRYYILLDELF